MQIIGHTLIVRFGELRELAGAVVWLVSSAAAGCVTGQIVVVDGEFSSVSI